VVLEGDSDLEQAAVVARYLVIGSLRASGYLVLDRSQHLLFAVGDGKQTRGEGSKLALLNQRGGGADILIEVGKQVTFHLVALLGSPFDLVQAVIGKLQVQVGAGIVVGSEAEAQAFSSPLDGVEQVARAGISRSSNTAYHHDQQQQAGESHAAEDAVEAQAGEEAEGRGWPFGGGCTGQHPLADTGAGGYCHASCLLAGTHLKGHRQ